MTVSTREVLEWLEHRARELDAAELRTILEAFATVRPDIPELVSDEDVIADTRAAARENQRRLITHVLPTTAPLTDEVASAVVVSAVRSWARRGIEMRTLTRAYRGAQRVFWSYWMEDVTARIDDLELRRAVLAHSWERVSAWYDAQFEQLEAIYTEERERWLRGAQARRAELIRSLLAGDAVDRERASVALGYDLRRVHTALVVWAADAELEALDEAVRDVARELGGGAILTLPAGSSALWAWIATDAEPPALAPRSDGVCVVVGRPARGVEGFRASHQDAQLARGLGLPGSLVAFDEVALACLAASEPDAMRRVVAHELGGLARRDPGVERLRETVRVYLECGANAREAAERLNMHKNTVHYRLARVEELRGRPIAERRLEFEVALMLTHVLGERVLPE